jgi:3-oxoacyl-[acyl-carrier protein] reductase
MNPVPSPRLTGRSAIVTGGGRNIGREIAVRLAAEGCDVAIVGSTHRDELENTASEIADYGRKAAAVTADVSIPGEVDRMVAEVLASFGAIDILVNNAAIRSYQSVFDLSLADWNRSMAVNLSGPFYCSRAVIPAMIERGGGSIININGSVAYVGGQHPAVTASKTGLLGLTRSLALELGPVGIRVNSVVLGWIDTVRTAAPPAETMALDLGLTPLRRIGRVRDVANACVYLASEEASYVTGQSVHLNGGRYML